MKSTNPDIIWFGSQYNDLALILKQAQQMNFGPIPLVGSAGDHTTGLLKVAGSAANNLYLHTLFFEESTDPAVQGFIDAFKKRFNASPNLFSAQAYEGLLMLADAIKVGNFTRDGTRDALTKISELPGSDRQAQHRSENARDVGQAFHPVGREKRQIHLLVGLRPKTPVKRGT